MKTRIILSSLALLLMQGLSAQVEVGLTIAPSASTFHAKGQDYSSYYMYPVNFGVTIKKSWGAFNLSSGITHLTQGLKTEGERVTTAEPDGTGEFYTHYDKFRTVAIPLLIGYKVFDKKSTSVHGGFGLYTGYIYSQKSEQDGRTMNLDWFDDLYLGVNVGVTVRQQISDQLSIELRPNYLHQIRKDLPKSTNAWTLRMKTWALGIGVCYQFGKEE